MEYNVTDKDLGIRIGSQLKISILSFHWGAIGGGLLFFGIDSDFGKTDLVQVCICYFNPLAPICDLSLKTPDNATAESSLDADYIGQEVTVECVEGFEFTDTPVLYTQPGDSGDAVTVGKIGNKLTFCTLIVYNNIL